MALAVGQRLGRYEILAPLGVGGMGEVYRARDERLCREVAVKVLKEASASKPGRLSRFEREARAVAALNHPNILTVHDVGVENGTPYIVTELLEGQTLRAALGRGGLAAPKAVEIGVQVALGLSAAHAKGILHRDLKPENVFLTDDGRVKILDFGLAKLRDDGEVGSQASTNAALSQAGTLLGTLGYMAPEQLQGQTLDVRADVFALGVVLHEMLSGRAPFRRGTAAATLAAILGEDPPRLSLTGRAVSATLEALVWRCLEKRPEDRFHSAHDLALALRTLSGEAASPASWGAEQRDSCPYPGLQPFLESDVAHFFGREAEIKALWERLRSHRLLAVIGASGAGKTSFVRAGVIPARPAGWGTLVVTPGRSPLASLARALAPELAGDPEALRELVACDDANVLVGLVARWRQRQPDALVAVDQFEELFTLNGPEVQAEFARLLGRLAAEAGIHVLLSLRDDFLMRCHEHVALAPVFTELTPLGPPGAEGLRRALVEPARKEGYRFEDEALVEEMLGAVEGERGALPLLAFAVSRLWEKRDRERRLLTREASAAIGGVAGALAQHAEATLDRIGRDRLGLVREIFRNLVTAQGTRAVIDREELLSAFEGRAAADLALRELIDARLLTSYEVEAREGEPSRQRVEIVHESLLRAWPRLVRWQAQDEEGAVLRDQLKQVAHLWDEKGRPDDLLWTGGSYREFDVWRERYPGRLTALEEAFAHATVARAFRKRRLQRAAVAAVMTALVVVATVIGVSRQDAVEQARRARASRLVALGRLELDRYPSAAVAYARASLEIADNLEARVLALEALWRGPTARVVAGASFGDLQRAAFSPDGRRLALAGFSESVVVVSEDGRVLHNLTGQRAVAEPRGVVFDPSGEHVLTYAAKDPTVRSFDSAGRLAETMPIDAEWIRFEKDGRLLVWGASDAGTQEPVLTVVEPDKEPRVLARWKPGWFIGGSHPGIRAPTSVDAALRWLAYGRDRRVFLHPLSEGGALRDAELGRHGARVREVLFHPSGGRLFSADDSGEIREWSVLDHGLIRSVQASAPDPYSGFSFDSEGVRIAWQSDQAACVLELAGPPIAPIRYLRRGDLAGGGGAATFHPRGTWLATPAGSSVALWPLGLPEGRVALVHRGGPILDLSFSQDSRTLASCARDGLRLSPIALEAGPPRRIELGSEYFCYGVAWSPAGRELALTAPLLGVYVLPGSGATPRKILEYPSQNVGLGRLAFDSDGRRVAVSTYFAPETRDRRIYVIDLESGSQRSLPQAPWEAGRGYAGQARALGFAHDGSLVIAGDGGIYRWDLAGGTSQTIVGGPGRFATFVMSADRRRLVANVGDRLDDLATIPNAAVWIIDLETGTQRAIRTHGDRLGLALATDPAGRIVVTGDAAGVIRVGSAAGEEPHLLLGHTGPVVRLAVSPDAKWIASASGAEVRLWPMPDLSKRPFHTLSLAQLLEKLRALTNLEVVEDTASPTGYKVAVGPFPGWKDVPTW